VILTGSPSASPVATIPYDISSFEQWPRIHVQVRNPTQLNGSKTECAPAGTWLYSRLSGSC
jgi:hypothetical protein